MNTAVLFALFFVFIQARPVPSFSNHFFGSFVRNTTYIGSSLSNHVVTFDLANKRVHVSITTESEANSVDSGEYWIINSPENAEPDSVQSTSNVVFTSRIAHDDESYCSYTTIPEWPSGLATPPGTFPPQWINSNDAIVLSNWFSLFDDLSYSGQDTWNYYDVDVWESDEECTVAHTDVPCLRVATHLDTKIPIATSIAHEKSGDFDTAWISVDWWNSFETTGVPPIRPPVSDWTTSCYNTENGFLIEPERGFVSTMSGMDNFTISLTSKPVSSLGPVHVRFVPSGISAARVDFVLEDGTPASGLSFTSANWNVPVRVFIKRRSDGETYFNVVGTGGGYDIPHIILSGQNKAQNETTTISFRAVTCAHGTVGYGC